MAMKRGSSSSPAPPRASADRATDALVVFGILVSLTFIGGSALLNYRMGFHSADNDVDGNIYGGLAAAGDGLKALSPFVAAWGWKHRDWLATIAATIVFVVFTAYSFTSALGFSSQHRASKQAANAGAIERHDDARATIRRDEARLNQLGPQRSSAEIRQAITNQLQAPLGSGRWTVDQLSTGCTVYKPVTRNACANVADLKLEAARSEEAERLAVDIRGLTTKKDAPVLQTADPQADALTFLGRVLHLIPAEDKKEDQDEKRTAYGLALLMAIFIELGSGLGLYISTTPWRSRAANTCAEYAPASSLPAIFDGPPIEAFAAERLERRQGHELYLAVAFEAYREWCELRDKPMLGRARFERGLLRLAKELGLNVDSGVSGWLLHDVRLRAGNQRRALRSP